MPALKFCVQSLLSRGYCLSCLLLVAVVFYFWYYNKVTSFPPVFPPSKPFYIPLYTLPQICGLPFWLFCMHICIFLHSLSITCSVCVMFVKCFQDCLELDHQSVFSSLGKYLSPTLRSFQLSVILCVQLMHNFKEFMIHFNCLDKADFNEREKLKNIC